MNIVPLDKYFDSMSALIMCWTTCFREQTRIFEPPKREDYKLQDIEWLTIRDFSVDAAEQKILDFIDVSVIASAPLTSRRSYLSSTFF